MSESADAAAFVRALRFDAAHPSFAGHFPGRPIVAGVLLLEAAADALRAWRGLSVPPVLLSGNHAAIDAWRHEQSLDRTRERRPDLLDRSDLGNSVKGD